MSTRPPAPSNAPRRAVRRALAPLCLAMALSGCKDLAVGSANLDALLDSDNHLRHVAPVRSGWRYYLDSILDPRWFGAKDPLFGTEEVKVPDPAYSALRNLLVVAEGDGARPVHRDLVQVRQFSRFALRSPGTLVRERAVLELAGHARRLGLTDLASVLGDNVPQEVIGGEELSDWLAQIITTVEPLLRQGDDATEETRQAFAAACGAQDVARMEIDGLWRMLKALETFAARVDLERELFTPLRELALQLEARSVALALAGSTVDPEPRVRAANVEACQHAFGGDYLLECVRRLRNPPPQDHDTRFAVQTASLMDAPVLERLFELIERHGLPARHALNPQEATQERFIDLRAILSIVNEGAHFPSRTRTAAMRALQRMVPEGPGTIREEEWVAWWQKWSQEQLAQLQTQPVAPGASMTP
ncbi:MAG: hypothetical protein R3F33_08880 [Planctomycetota bacterium]